MDKKILMKTSPIKMQRIDFLSIPNGFKFEENDTIYNYLQDGYFVEFPNENLKDFMFGEVFNTFKIIT